MPFYDFKCTNEECNNFQPNELVKMGTTETICQVCGGKTEKQMSYRFAATGLPNGHITNRSSMTNAYKNKK